ncbi:MAG: hypothetical protein AMJ95_08510, partial [Omnitrophica WOR_2 bacterium SM23_72]
MDAKDKIREKSEQESKPLKEQPEHKSRFKPWIRIVAFLVIAVFLPEQVAQAIEFDGRVLWNRPGVYVPTYLKDIQNVNIPLAVKKILLDISGKPVNAIKISPALTIELEKPLNITKRRVEEIYHWLEGKPCGSKALYDFLGYKGVAVVEQDVAVLALTIDILNGVVKPEGDPEVIKNSLYALSQASDFFGHKLYPVRLRAPSSELRANLTPFIAHLKTDHYILITRITDEKVYFIEEHKEEFWPKDKFLKEFSGFALVSNSQLPTPNTELLSDSQAKQILGARHCKYEFADLSMFFEKPSWKDQLLALGLTALTSVVGGWGGGVSGMVGAFGATCFTSQLSTLATNVAQYEFEWTPEQSALFGMAISSGFNMGISSAINPPKFTDAGFQTGRLGMFEFAPSSLQHFAVNHPVITGFTMGLATGAAQGYAQLAIADAINRHIQDDDKYATDYSSVTNGIASLFGAAGTTFAFNTFMGALPGGTDLWGAIKGTWQGPIDVHGNPTYELPKYLVSQGTALGFEYLAIRNEWMKPEYSRILGQGVGSMFSSLIPSQQPTQNQWFTIDNWPNLTMLGNAAVSGLVNSGISIGLTALANQAEDNEWLKATMPYLSLAFSDIIYSVYNSASNNFVKTADGLVIPQSQAYAQGITSWQQANISDILKLRFTQQSLDYLSFGGTNPFIPQQNYTTFDFALFNTKMWDFTGLNQYVSAVEALKAQINEYIKENPEAAAYMSEDSWRHHRILPDLMQSLVYYGRSWSHAQATNTLTDLTREIYAELGGSRLGAYQLGGANLLGKNAVNPSLQNQNDSALASLFKGNTKAPESPWAEGGKTYPLGDGKELHVKQTGSRVEGSIDGIDWHGIESSAQGDWKLNMPMKKDIHFTSEAFDQDYAQFIKAEKIEKNYAFYQDGTKYRLDSEKDGISHALQELWRGVTLDSSRLYHGTPQFEEKGRNIYLFRDPSGSSFSGLAGITYFSPYETISARKGASPDNRLIGFIASEKGITDTFNVQDWKLSGSGITGVPTFTKDSVGYLKNGYMGGSGWVSLPSATGYLRVEQNRFGWMFAPSPSEGNINKVGTKDILLMEEINNLAQKQGLSAVRMEGSDIVFTPTIAENTEQGYLLNQVFFDGLEGKVLITPNDKFRVPSYNEGGIRLPFGTGKEAFAQFNISSTSPQVAGGVTFSGVKDSPFILDVGTGWQNPYSAKTFSVPAGEKGFAKAYIQWQGKGWIIGTGYDAFAPVQKVLKDLPAGVEPFNLNTEKSLIKDFAGNTFAINDYTTVRNLTVSGKEGPLSTVFSFNTGEKRLTWFNAPQSSGAPSPVTLRTQTTDNMYSIPGSSVFNSYQGFIEIDARTSSLEPMLFNDGAKHSRSGTVNFMNFRIEGEQAIIVDSHHNFGIRPDYGAFEAASLERIDLKGNFKEGDKVHALKVGLPAGTRFNVDTVTSNLLSIGSGSIDREEKLYAFSSGSALPELVYTLTENNLQAKIVGNEKSQYISLFYPTDSVLSLSYKPDSAFREKEIGVTLTDEQKQQKQAQEASLDRA